MYFAILSNPIITEIIKGVIVLILCSSMVIGAVALGIRDGFREYERKQKMKEDLENEYQEKLNEYKHTHGYANS